MMSKKYNLNVGFAEGDKERIVTHLEKLLTHLTPHKFALVGGIAILIT